MTVLDVLQLKCYYRFTFQRDSSNTASKLSEQMVLLIGKRGVSRFSSVESIKKDSALTVLRQQREQFGSDYVKARIPSLPSSKFRFSVFKNYPADKITVTDEIFIQRYIYEEEKGPIRWTLTQQKAKVNGYNCQKATARTLGRNYEAWYTIEIPVSDGPYKFYGLPGLIVKLTDSRNFFSFELTRLVNSNSSEKIVISRARLRPTTKKAFFQGYRNFMEDRAGVIEAQVGGKMGRSPQYMKMVEEERRTNNNFIEW